MTEPNNKPLPPWRARLHDIIFESDTPAGKAFDVALIWCILLSVLAVILESVRAIGERYGDLLRAVEWAFTILFSIEYGLRLLSVQSPLRYARSFFGVVDLLAILPTYLSLFVTGTQSLLVIRGLRLLRVFRIFKMRRYVDEMRVLITALRASQAKITVFLVGVLTSILIIGSLMYLIEGEENGFTSIPQSLFWAIVTITTVGYGDLVPQTVSGRVLASVLMILGYGIIAVPTGIVTVELAQASRQQVNARACENCSKEGHDLDARHCKACGARL